MQPDTGSSFSTEDSKLSEALNFVFVSYYDWGIGFKYFRAGENIQLHEEDAAGNSIGVTDNPFNFSNGNIFGRFSIHKNINMEARLFART